MEVIQLECPLCTAAVSSTDKKCGHCKRPIMLSNYQTAASLPLPELNKYANSYRKQLAARPDNMDMNASLGVCYLRLKMYDKALEAFEKAMPDNFDNPEPFYLAAVSLLQGKKAFLTPRPNIDKALEYLNAACMIEMRPVFYYFMAYIKYDYFERKCLNTSPNYHELLQQANEYGISEPDVEALFEMLGVARPDAL